MRKILVVLILFWLLPSFAQDEEGGLKVTGLAAIDASAIGSLRPFNGGFSADLWQGLEAEQVITAIENLPTRYNRTELFLLARAILLTASPLGESQIGEGEAQLEISDSSRAFILARLNKLYDMGLYADAWELLSLVPGEYYNVSFERMAIDLQLQLGDYVKACESLPNDNELPQSEDNFWQKLLFLCEVLDNRPADADFILNVFNEVNAFSDEFVLLGQQALGVVPSGNLSAGDGDVISQILQEIVKPLTFNAEQYYSIAESHRLLQSDEVSDDNKALIGLRLHRQGIISNEALMAIYAKLPYRSGRAKATRLTEEDYPHAYRALAGDDENSRAKGKIIRSLILAADGGGYLPETLRQLSPYVNLEPDKGLKSYAKLLAVAELFKNNTETANAWHKISRGKDDKADIYDLLLLLSESNLISNYPVKLTDIYSLEYIKLITPPALLLADDIMRNRRELLLDASIWQDLQIDSNTSQSVNRKLLLKARLLEAQIKENSSLALLEFVKDGNAIVNEDPEGYIRIWRAVALPVLSRQAIMGYFLENGFILGDD